MTLITDFLCNTVTLTQSVESDPNSCVGLVSGFASHYGLTLSVPVLGVNL